MKLEVGMYVRTRDGFLWKPKKIEIEEDNSVWFDDYYDYDVSDVKASHNIIDLIEVGDYVNGYKVYYCYCADEDSTGLFIDTETKKRVWLDKPNQIKSIVTKEQFSSMEYRLGE